MARIRRARTEDALGVHEAHMRSIREVCSLAHSSEEIGAWGHRPFRGDQRIEAITTQFVWVVEEGGVIEGYAHLSLNKKNGKKIAHIFGLYLTKTLIGRGLGAKLARLMLAKAKTSGAGEVTLESSLTAHRFYLALGFKDVGAMTTINIGGIGIRCIPMCFTFESEVAI